ncbi:MAG: hypothetical protein P1U53_00430 [Sulfitobacter sp.]|nr:hypothetical protein [Sulfitobacter sp.]
MPRPASQDFAALRAEGATRILSLLEPAEATDLGLQDEAALCAANSLAFTHYPIPDYGLPDPDTFDALVERLFAGLEGGENLVLHCRGGIGRSGLVAAALLIRTGVAAEQAMRQVSAARGCDTPETPQQRAFILNWRPVSQVP